jgi:hypothetical protein
MAAITAAVASGELTPGEAGQLSGVVEAFVKATEATELERRLNKDKPAMRRDFLQRIERLEQTGRTSANPLPILFFHFTKNKTTSAAPPTANSGLKYHLRPKQS